jgi:hypothetical protein
MRSTLPASARFAAQALAVALALAACGGAAVKTVNDRSASHAATTASTPAATGRTPTTSRPRTPPRAGTSTRPGAGTPACTAAMLKLSYLGGQGATGHALLAFALTNATGSSCHTYGYPGVEFLSAAGKPLPTNAIRTVHDFFGPAPARVLTLAPGQAASFRLGTTDQGAGGSSAGCQTASALQVIPPDDTHALSVGIGSSGGAYECGTASVTPLQPGSSALPSG